MHFVVLLLLLPIAACSAGDREKLIFILAGQSNMSGRGGVAGGKWDHQVPAECEPSPSILRLNALFRWETAAEPLHADIDVRKICGVGPGLAFARAVLEELEEEVEEQVVLGLVPCAVGGTRISEWERGQKLYDEMIKRAKAAVGGGGRIGAVLWYQGESDTVSRSDAAAYKSRMERLVSDLRADLQDSQQLVIQVALASGEGPYVEIVRQAQLSIKLRNVLHVDAEGLQLEEDNLHLTTQAQVQLGKMLAAAYLNHTASARKPSLHLIS